MTIRLNLLHIAVLALATFTFAASLPPTGSLNVDLSPIAHRDTDHSGYDAEFDVTADYDSDATWTTAASTKRAPWDIAELLDEFDMKKTFIMEGPGSKKTRVLSADAMAAVPTKLRFEVGRFDPDAVISAANLVVSPQVFGDIRKVIEVTRYTSDLVKSPISGEQGLTHVLYQQLAGPLNAIIAAVGQGDWSARGKGNAPKEDWRYIVDRNDTRAVLELKTNQALQSHQLTTLKKITAANKLTMMPVKDDDAGLNAVKVNSLVDFTRGTAPQSRATRAHEILALEQVIAQMYATKSFFGVLTNGEQWLICQRTPPSLDGRIGPVRNTRSRVDTIAITKLNGIKPDGKSRALEILLAVSLAAAP